MGLGEGVRGRVEVGVEGRMRLGEAEGVAVWLGDGIDRLLSPGLNPDCKPWAEESGRLTEWSLASVLPWRDERVPAGSLLDSVPAGSGSSGVQAPLGPPKMGPGGLCCRQRRRASAMPLLPATARERPAVTAPSSHQPLTDSHKPISLSFCISYATQEPTLQRSGKVEWPAVNAIFSSSAPSGNSGSQPHHQGAAAQARQPPAAPSSHGEPSLHCCLRRRLSSNSTFTVTVHPGGSRRLSLQMC